MDELRAMKRAKSKLGGPLYITVREVLREAIVAGIFSPGHRMPSTQALSAQLDVSLVTTHRAMQELVGSGVLQRAQGRGTFVHAQFRERIRSFNEKRIGIVLNPDTSLENLHYCFLAEGIRRRAWELAADVVLLRFAEDIRNECSGFLLVSPPPQQVEAFLSRDLLKPTVVLDSAMRPAAFHSVQLDHQSAAHQAVEHLANLGHRSIGYIGADEHVPNAGQLWEGFLNACLKHGISPQEPAVIQSMSWKLDPREQLALIRMLGSQQRPTAIFAAGYSYAVDVYRAAAIAGISVPDQLSVVGVDDAPSASQLAPPLTTIWQPLHELGQVGIDLLVQLIDQPELAPEQRTLPVELVIRGSTAAKAN